MNIKNTPVFLWCFLCVFWTKAQNNRIEETKIHGKIKIATRNLEPFSFMENGERKGFSVDLWNEISRNLGMDYEWVELNSANEIITSITKGKSDVGVGAISVTFNRELSVDFSHPFYESGLQILVNKSDDSSGSLFGVLKTLISWNVIIPIIIVFIVIIIVSNLIWIFERKINPDQWPENFKPGMIESVWFTITTMLVGGTDNKGPIGMGGRIITIFWMIASTILISFVTATLTTTMTVNKLTSKIDGPEDLPGLKVATIKGSNTCDWLKKRNIKVVEMEDITECIGKLQKHKVDAVVYDAPILQYELSKYNSDKINLVGPIFNRQYYAFPINENTDMLKKINQTILKLHENGFIIDLRRKYFKENY